MAKRPLPYELSPDADKDLDTIFDYTESKFSFNQAVAYLSGFDDVFNRLSDNPKLGRERKDIRAGLRSIVKESHIVFYRVLKDRIWIVRVLHGSRDVKKFIPPGE